MKRKTTRIRKANPIKLSHVVQTIVGDLGIASDIYLEKLKRDWREVVGKTNARNTRPVSLKNGVLTIAVSSPVWITQARFYKTSFLHTIKHFYPQDTVEIHDISFILEIC